MRHLIEGPYCTGQHCSSCQTDHPHEFKRAEDTTVCVCECCKSARLDIPLKECDKCHGQFVTLYRQPISGWHFCMTCCFTF